MAKEKYKTCRHSTGNVGTFIVEVHPTCPEASAAVGGTLTSTKEVCQRCIWWERSGKKNGK